jgi:hypothetical protein
MKLFTIQSFAIMGLLFASPALAQTNDQAVSEGAGVIAWILVGLIGGYLASRMVNKTGEGLVRDIILGHCRRDCWRRYIPRSWRPWRNRIQPLEHPGRVHRRRRGAANLPCYVSAAASLN